MPFTPPYAIIMIFLKILLAVILFIFKIINEFEDL